MSKKIRPENLLRTLQSLLNASGGLNSVTLVPRLVSLMQKFSKKLVSRVTYINIIQASSTQILEHILRERGWELMITWVSGAISSLNEPLAAKLLKLFLECPQPPVTMKIDRVLDLTAATFPGLSELVSNVKARWLDSVPSEKIGASGDRTEELSVTKSLLSSQSDLKEKSRRKKAPTESSGIQIEKRRKKIKVIFIPDSVLKIVDKCNAVPQRQKNPDLFKKNTRGRKPQTDDSNKEENERDKKASKRFKGNMSFESSENSAAESDEAPARSPPSLSVSSSRKVSVEFVDPKNNNKHGYQKSRGIEDLVEGKENMNQIEKKRTERGEKRKYEHDEELNSKKRRKDEHCNELRKRKEYHDNDLNSKRKKNEDSKKKPRINEKKEDSSLVKGEVANNLRVSSLACEEKPGPAEEALRLKVKADSPSNQMQKRKKVEDVKAVAPKLEMLREVNMFECLESSEKKKKKSSKAKSRNPKVGSKERSSGSKLLPNSETLKKPVKRVNWPADKDLVTVKMFQVDDEEKKFKQRNFEEQKKIHKRNELNIFKISREKQKDEKPWSFPVALEGLSKDLGIYSKNSREKERQKQREAQTPPQLAGPFFPQVLEHTAEVEGVSLHGRLAVPVVRPQCIPLEDQSGEGKVSDWSHMDWSLLNTEPQPRGTRPFSRAGLKKVPVACIYWGRGYCKNGDRCKFIHGPK